MAKTADTQTSAQSSGQTSAKSTTETVVLAKPHTHQGKVYAPGTRLTVPTVTANWLRAQGVVNPAASADLTAPG
jgi:hypothetical protein